MTSDSPRGSVPAPAAAAAKRAARPQVASAHNDGWLMAVELVTATFTWGGIGFLVDRYWLHTEPVFMSIGFVVGFFAGMYLLWLKTSTAPATPDATEGGDGADT
jgi:F0F1-type ATP synthase assembly protein I